jgi:hypothetical protein
MTGLELALEFTDLWEDLDPGQINQLLAQNIHCDLLEFFSCYAEEFAVNSLGEVSDPLRKQLPNLLIIGYIIRLLEERVT